MFRFKYTTKLHTLCAHVDEIVSRKSSQSDLANKTPFALFGPYENSNLFGFSAAAF
jgi:hypothetical protein